MREIGDDAMAVLQAHSWPGNVRQLRNIVERLLILASDDVDRGDHRPIFCPPIWAAAAAGAAARAAIW